MACLLHDLGQALIKTDHGWWGAQLFAPYVSEKSASLSNTIRHYNSSQIRLWVTNIPNNTILFLGGTIRLLLIFGQHTNIVESTKWYMSARLITVNDLYSFDPNHFVDIEQFTDIIGRHIKQPKEGLGFDDRPSAHMWRRFRPPTPLFSNKRCNGICRCSRRPTRAARF